MDARRILRLFIDASPVWMSPAAAVRPFGSDDIDVALPATGTAAI
jgi:hypothetical protein